MLSEQTKRDSYNRQLDHQSGIFSKTFWNLLFHEEDRLRLFVGSTLAVIGGIVGITLASTIAVPAVAVTLGCACGGIIGVGSGLLEYDFSLQTAMNGLSWKQMLSCAFPDFMVGGIAGGLTVGIEPLINSGLQLLNSAPAIISLISSTCQYVIYQMSAVTVEGAFYDRWEGYDSIEVAIDVGVNILLSVTLGASLGTLADYASLNTVEELAFFIMTTIEIIIVTLTSAELAKITVNRNIKGNKLVQNMESTILVM